MNRRGFLKSLIAAAVATQLPSLPSAEAKPIVNNIFETLIKTTMNGKEPDSVTLQFLENGWCRVEALFKNAVTGRIKVDFGKNSVGIPVSKDESLVLKESNDDYVLSFLARPSLETPLISNAQLMKELKPPAYIKTTTKTKTRPVESPSNLVLWSDNPKLD